jgi:hypothetical protein
MPRYTRRQLAFAGVCLGVLLWTVLATLQLAAQRL